MSVKLKMGYVRPISRPLELVTGPFAGRTVYMDTLKKPTYYENQ